MSIGVDTAAAPYQVGTGADQPQDLAAAPAQDLGTTSIDQYFAKQAADEAAAAQAALIPNQPDNTSAGLPATGVGIGGKIVAMARKYLGTDYKWGGEGPGGVDCSGLVALAYRAAGINLPRISYEQANSGKRVGINQLRAGDLVAWDNSSRNPGADHIAIYIGNGEIIEAPQPGVPVRIRSLGKNEGSFWGVQMGWK